jgi:hypothetical protein
MVEKDAEEYPCCGQDSNSDTSLLLTPLSVSMVHSCCKYNENTENIGFVLKTPLNPRSYENTLLLAIEDLFSPQQVMNENMFFAIMT